jgi:hypothetical protein
VTTTIVIHVSSSKRLLDQYASSRTPPCRPELGTMVNSCSLAFIHRVGNMQKPT